MSDPSRAVARYDGPRTIDELERYSRLMADGRSVLPAQYRNQPGAIMFAVEYAKALDVSPITALTGIHVIEGKPTASAGLISALIRRAGHELRVSLEGTVEDGDLRAIATLTRTDDPDHRYESVWTLRRAARAGLLSLHVETEGGVATTVVRARSSSGSPLPWETYTESMLKARAVTEVGRDGAEDVLLGVHYTPEELGAEVDSTGDVVHTVTTLSADTSSDAGATAREHVEAAEQVAAQAAAAAPEGDSVVDRVEVVRNLILDATTRDELAAAWSRPDLLNGSTEAFKAADVADHQGTMSSLYDLFGRAVHAVKLGEAPLRPRPDDGQGAETDTPAEDPDGAVDAEIVEDPPAEPEEDRTPSVQIGDPRHGVAVPGDSSAAERADALRLLPITDARAELDRIMTALPQHAQAEVIEWARSQGVNPAHSSGNCAMIAGAIAIGDCFSDATLSAFAAGDGEDPIELVIRVLGGEVVARERVNDPEEAHRRDLEARRAEDHVDAEQWTVARRGTPAERSQAARTEARAAIRRAQEQTR